MEQNSLEEILEKHVPENDMRLVQHYLYGRVPVPLDLQFSEKNQDLEVRGYSLINEDVKEQVRAPRIVRVGLIQTSIVLPTSSPVQEQRDALHQKVASYIEHAAACKVNVVCFPESWHAPFFFPTREKTPYCEFAEDAEIGPTVTLMRKLSQQYNMVIVCPIFERDAINGEVLWITAVVIDCGKIMGKYRKNHIPGLHYSETAYCEAGKLEEAHPVFDTTYGKIGVVICYGRFHPLNWCMKGINSAEMVFCPSAVISGIEESLWNIQGRSAAVDNSYFTFSLNRVGTEAYDHAFTTGAGAPPKKEFGHFFGSCYGAAPDGARTPNLGRHRDGLMVIDCDLNLCRHAKDFLGLRMTQRLDHYAQEILKATKPDFKRQIVKK